VNLRYGVKHEMSRTGGEKDTCTACAGTMLLEFSALSRLTADPVFEVNSLLCNYVQQKAVRALDCCMYVCMCIWLCVGESSPCYGLLYVCLRVRMAVCRRKQSVLWTVVCMFVCAYGSV